ARTARGSRASLRSAREKVARRATRSAVCQRCNVVPASAAPVQSHALQPEEQERRSSHLAELAPQHQQRIRFWYALNSANARPSKLQPSALRTRSGPRRITLRKSLFFGSKKKFSSLTCASFSRAPS